MGIDKWFSNVGLAETWRRDFEGDVVAGFLVVEKYMGNFFFFFSSSGLTAMMFQIDQCLL